MCMKSSQENVSKWAVVQLPQKTSSPERCAGVNGLTRFLFANSWTLWMMNNCKGVVGFGREASEGHFKKSAKHKGLKIRMSQVTRMGKLFWLEQRVLGRVKRSWRCLTLERVSRIFEKSVVHWICPIQCMFLKINTDILLYLKIWFYSWKLVKVISLLILKKNNSSLLTEERRELILFKHCDAQTLSHQSLIYRLGNWGSKWVKELPVKSQNHDLDLLVWL